MEITNRPAAAPAAQTAAPAAPAAARQTERPQEQHRQQEGPDVARLEDVRQQPPKPPDAAKSQAVTTIQSETAGKVTGTQDRKGPEPPYDPTQDADSLFKAMDGWGTDEAAVFKALEGKSPEQIAKLREAYRNSYGKSLDAHVRSEMSGSDLKRAESFLSGNNAAGDAIALHQAMAGMGTDEQAIYKTLDGKSEKDRDAIQQEYRKRYGVDLMQDMKGDLSGDDLRRAEAQLKGDAGKADAAVLHQAMAGLGTDEETVYKTLEGKTPEQRAAIEKSYQEQYGTTLQRDIGRDFSGDEQRRAEALRKGDGSSADAAVLHDAVAGPGTDEASIYKTLEGKTPEQRAAIEKAYRDQYGAELRTDLAGDMSGAELDRAEALLDGKGARADAARLKEAMDGLGTDEDAIFKTLEGRTPEERRKIADEYKTLYNNDLMKDLESELSGGDLDRAKKLLAYTPPPDPALMRLIAQQQQQQQIMQYYQMMAYQQQMMIQAVQQMMLQQAMYQYMSNQAALQGMMMQQSMFFPGMYPQVMMPMPFAGFPPMGMLFMSPGAMSQGMMSQGMTMPFGMF